MKSKLILALVFVALLILAPLLAMLGGTTAPSALPTQPVEPGEGGGENSAPANTYTGDALLIYDEATGEVLSMSERDYVIGAVMAEMPALYNDEALKAQAVACHTYALCVKQLRLQVPDPSLNGAYFSVNTHKMSGLMTEEKAAGYYGSSYDQYYNKIVAAVDTVFGQILIYDNQPISACYHAISPGKTENSENVFATALPYLVTVDSAADSTAENYQTTASFSASEFESLLGIYNNQFSASGDPANWITGDIKKSEAGTVLSIVIGGVNFRGTEVRAALSLRSAAFDVVYNAEAGTFDFTVYGYGHGVGMSQYGANAMAGSGSNYAEILAHYYTGAQLVALAPNGAGGAEQPEPPLAE